MVPMPPTSVISTMSPEVLKFTSVSVAMPNTSAFAPPAIPAMKQDRMKAISL